MEERLEAGGNGAETTESDDKGTSDLGQDKEVGKQKTGSPIMYVSCVWLRQQDQIQAHILRKVVIFN